MKKLLSLLALCCFLSVSAFSQMFEVKIYWDGSIPGAHVYAWDGELNTGNYLDLGEIRIGASTVSITNVPNFGADFLVTTPSAFSVRNSATSPVGVGLLQVWVYNEWAGINWYPDAFQFNTWEPEPFMCDYINGVIPDGLGGWKDGDPYIYAQPIAPVQQGKRLAKGHNK